MATLCEGPYRSNRVTQTTTGRRRRFCSPACRQAAYRRRRSEIVWESAESVAHEPRVIMTESMPCPDDAAAVAIVEARTLAGVFTNLGRHARPQLAWRCIKTSEAIHSALDDYFEGADR